MAIRYLHDRVTLDDQSYICQPYHINGSISALHVGKYTSIAQNLHVDLGYQHDYKNVTTFPMHTIANVPSNLFCRGDVNVGSDCWLGENVTLMGGITIGNGAIVGANETVRRDILPYEIFTGSKIAEKFRFDYETRQKLLNLAWWDWDEARILENAELLVQPNINKFLNEHI